MNVGSLFSGIGGFDLGLERAGMRTVWFCEQNPYRRRVLARHWPGVPVFDDVCALVADTDAVDSGRGQFGEVEGASSPDEGADKERERVRDAAGYGGAAGRVPVPVPYVDVLCGGFPCQDLSYAGAGAGIDGARSGLWAEFARLIGELRPRYVIVENVPALLARGMGRVLGDLAACGYDAEWDCLSAAAFGAPHRRDRVWLVAYPDRSGEPSGAVDAEAPRDADVAGRPLAYPDAERRAGGSGGLGEGRRGEPSAGGWWLSEPDVGRVANGVPNRVDRLAALGDALVPQIAEWIGHRIMDYERQHMDVAA